MLRQCLALSSVWTSSEAGSIWALAREVACGHLTDCTPEALGREHSEGWREEQGLGARTVDSGLGSF